MLQNSSSKLSESLSLAKHAPGHFHEVAVPFHTTYSHYPRSLLLFNNSTFPLLLTKTSFPSRPNSVPFATTTLGFIQIG